MINLSRVSKKFIIPNRNSFTLFRALSRGINNPAMYKTIHALDKVDLCINRGETLGIIGPNGSGKSTLLRIIAGIYKPTSGVFQVEGVVTSVLQTKISLFQDLSVKENIFLFGAIMGLSRKEIHKIYDKIIDLAGLSEFTNVEVRVLSEGMRERFSFAISVETAKDILLLDEVVLVGDSKFREKCLKIIMKFKEEQKTILLASHDLGIVNEFCDNTLLLNKGKVFAFGKTKEVINSYLELVKT
jgi:ABC-type polysaccharide/polyol phosphate transport system ATPase subunit